MSIGADRGIPAGIEAPPSVVDGVMGGGRGPGTATAPRRAGGAAVGRRARTRGGGAGVDVI